MPSQRIILGTGLAILLVIGAASIGLDIKSRSDTASVDHALGIAAKNLGHAAAAAPGRERGARPSRSPAIRNSPRNTASASDAILPALDGLIETVKDNPSEKRLIEETKALVERQIAINGELIRLRNAGDNAGIAALVGREDRAATAAIAGNLEKAVAEERRLLVARRAESETNGRILLAIDLAGVALILILATVLTLSTRRSRRELQDLSQRHQSHQRGAGGRGRRAHRASGRRP